MKFMLVHLEWVRTNLMPNESPLGILIPHSENKMDRSKSILSCIATKSNRLLLLDCLVPKI